VSRREPTSQKLAADAIGIDDDHGGTGKRIVLPLGDAIRGP
jgi:hypothetical protein